MSTTLDLSELEFKIGQMFMIGMPGPQMDDTTRNFIREHHIGGVIFFSRNIADPLQLCALCNDLQECARQSRNPPLFLAVDQEGGRVARLKEPFSRFPGNEAMARDPHPLRRVREFARTTAKEMKLAGLNMNLAPVLDVQRGPLEAHLAGRTFGDDPQAVAELGSTVIRILQKNNVMACAKHFPGLGRAALDPHLRLPRIELLQEELESVNLPPFRAAVQADVSAIMTSHALYPLLDAENPATVSALVLTEWLRKRLGFKGLIVTDDLEMGAMIESGGVARSACAALKAGADILLVCKEAHNVFESLQLIRSRILDSEIPVQKVMEAAERIRKTKERYCGKRTKRSVKRIRNYFKF